MRNPLLVLVLTAALVSAGPTAQTRPRARDLGIAPGLLQPGPHNAITDVAGVRVGHRTLIEGDTIRTGVTAILPHGGNLFREKVAGGVFVGNAFGKLAGSTQVEELGTIESPIVLTNTLSVGVALDAIVRWTIARPGNESVRSVNGLVGETNDGTLNDIRGLHVTREHVAAAIAAAAGDTVEEGAVGAGTGTVAFGWKGGIGTSSRVVPQQADRWTVGVLVQTNYGGRLTIAGIPVWKVLTPPASNNAADVSRRSAEESIGAPDLSRHSAEESIGAPDLSRRSAEESIGAPNLSRRSAEESIGAPNLSRRSAEESSGAPDLSCMIVVATDAPLDARDLKRLAARAIYALARTGSTYSNGSGDFAIAFSTHPSLRVTSASGPQPRTVLPTDGVSGLFEAAMDATEEAVYNSMLKAVDVSANGRTIRALPIEQLRKLLDRR